MQSEPDQRKLVEAVKSWLEGCSQPWLLIYDNADDPLAVEPYLPRSGNGSILLTTRDQAVSAFAAPLSVDTMSLQEGIDLLLKRARCADTASQAEQAAARAIVQALDAFPLALDQAGAYIEESECRLVDYLQLYQRHPATLLGRRGRQASQYPDAVATTWAISFAKVEQASPAAADLLRLCAFLAPDQIPEEIISEGAAHRPPALQQAASDPLVFNEMIAELRKYSLVSRLPESHSLRLHRLVQAVQLDTMDLETQRQWAERVVLALYALFPHDPDDVKTWPRCQRLLAQAQACHEMIERYTLQRIEAAHLLHNAGMYLIDHALYEQAEPLYQHALSIKEQELGPEHLDTTATLGNLANLYLEQGQHEQAEALYQRVLAIKERQLGPEHPDTATTLNNVAELYTDQGQYEQAEPLYQRALAIYERMLGPEHPRTQRVRRKYAELLQAMGRETEAEKMEEG
jgi:tetratricopeptide (TPR) repeat protein